MTTYSRLAGSFQETRIIKRKRPWPLATTAAVFTALATMPVDASKLPVPGLTTTFQGPSGASEYCVAIDAMPSARYSAEDKAAEAAFCRIDFYSGDYALCPKVFSTSPGTLVYDISRGPFAGDAAAFETAQCATSSPAKRGAVGEPVSYKMTMNASDTSATFSTASLLYYHFSRYLDADVHVPVSVYRSMDKDIHLQRVTRPGVTLSAQRRGGAMNHAGWETLRAAEQNPGSYPATGELFTPDRRSVFGILIHPQGDRYGAEFNGTRRSGWGAGQNRDFQETAAFRALRADKPLTEAIQHGIHEASADRTLRKAMRNGVSPEQMVFWMKELTEITLLDFIFSQQDRIGNIDYLTYWYWTDDGEVKRRPAAGSAVPDDIADFHPFRLKRTQLNDNDAGGRLPYANFTKKTRMLEKIRHYGPDTYRRLMRLDRDFADRGELYRYVRDTFGLSDRQFQQVLKNTRMAADILRNTCHAGKLRFDLDPHAFLKTGKVAEQQVDCDQP